MSILSCVCCYVKGIRFRHVVVCNVFAHTFLYFINYLVKLPSNANFRMVLEFTLLIPADAYLAFINMLCSIVPFPFDMYS